MNTKFVYVPDEMMMYFQMLQGIHEKVSVGVDVVVVVVLEAAREEGHKDTRCS